MLQWDESIFEDSSHDRIGLAQSSNAIALSGMAPSTPRASAATARHAQACAATGAGAVTGVRLPWFAKRAARSSAIVAAPSTLSLAAVLMVW